MASVVPQSASCYTRRPPRALQLFGRPGAQPPSLFKSSTFYRGPRTRFINHTPKMTIRQIYQLLRAIQQVPSQDVAPRGTIRQQATPRPASGPPVSTATGQ
ncbi:hypothetical protein GN956_G22536 [Arapaima gigas]